VTLFNALTPSKAENLGIQSLPSISIYGSAQLDVHREDRRRTTADIFGLFQYVMGYVVHQRLGLWLISVSYSENGPRRYSYPLKAGHKVAYLCTETTDHEYMDSLIAPKKWFRTHVDLIMQTYGVQHNIKKEDLFLGVSYYLMQTQETNHIFSNRHPSCSKLCTLCQS
jgi:hypothetical protein